MWYLNSGNWSEKWHLGAIITLIDIAYVFKAKTQVKGPRWYHYHKYSVTNLVFTGNKYITCMQS